MLFLNWDLEYNKKLHVKLKNKIQGSNSPHDFSPHAIGRGHILRGRTTESDIFRGKFLSYTKSIFELASSFI